MLIMLLVLGLLLLLLLLYLEALFFSMILTNLDLHERSLKGGKLRLQILVVRFHRGYLVLQVLLAAVESIDLSHSCLK